MKKNNSIVITWSRGLVISTALILSASLSAQQDTALNRSVTVERDFQPVIQAAGKVATKPAVVETEIEPIEVSYSDYTVEVNPEVQMQPLLSQPTRFGEGHNYNGYVRGGLGHTNTLFDFGYHLNDGKSSILDVYAHHRAQWGLRALSKTKLGLDFTHPFSRCSLYFGLNGGNIYYHKYGHFYDYSHGDAGAWERTKTLYPEPRTLTPADKTTLWTAEAYIGVKANAKEEFQYRVQTGYMIFAKPNAVAEHQLRTHASFEWNGDAHRVGAKLYVQNNFMTLSGNLGATIPSDMYNSRHNIRLEPYYAYSGSRVQLHLGVNLDMNIGRGKNDLSGVDNLSFAPSPHVHLEAQIAKQWLTFYADATGLHGMGTVQAFMEANRYRVIHAGIISMHPANHTPVDAEAGFHIRPHRDLLIELHGGYALYLNTTTLIAVTDSARYNKVLNVPLRGGDLSYTYSDYSRGKIGGQVNYHYRDYVRVHLNADYFFWRALRNESNGYNYASVCTELTDLLNNTSKTVYDRANWQLALRVDGKIDKHWSVYSDNHFAGSRLALANDGEHKLKPTVELNLGCQYNMWVGKASSAHGRAGQSQMTNELPLRPETRPNLTLFAQVNNFIHYKNDLYYGYTSEGINFLVGATFRF